MSNTLGPINLRENTSIITITDAGMNATIGQEKEIVNFYINDRHRLFNKEDRSKTRTPEAIPLIQNINRKFPRNQLNPRNHVNKGKTPIQVNNMTITFTPTHDEFNGVIRYNHTTNKTEHYDINILKKIENDYNEQQGIKFNLNALIHILFDTKEKDDIYFDNQVTIIPIMCRGFDQDLVDDMPAQERVRRLSLESDSVPSADGVEALLPAVSRKILPLNNDKKWIGVNTKVLLSNGLIGFVKNLYITSVRFNVETFIPKLTLKGLVDDSIHNGKECAFTGAVTKSATGENIWPVTVLTKGNPNINIKSENIVLCEKTITHDLHRETIIEILEDPSPRSYIQIVSPPPSPPPNFQLAQKLPPPLQMQQPQQPSALASAVASAKPSSEGINYSKFDKIYDSDEE
jgi:hypothetical protein